MAVLQFIGILSVLVILHELGHLLVAKWCGMRVEKFSLFFGRPLLKKTWGETQYAIGWIPLGGYVKITGMTAWEAVPEEHCGRTYARSSVPRRMATIAAGPAVNLVLAFLLFAAVFWIGVPTQNVTNRVDQVVASGPAAAAGFQPGDEILSVNGVRGESRVRQEILGSPGERVRIEVRRGTERVTLTPTVRADRGSDGATVGRIGIVFATTPGPRIQFGPWEGLTSGVRTSWTLTKETFLQLSRLPVSEEARDNTQSVVGAGAVYTEIAEQGLATILLFAGALSLALAIFNLLPIPPLDGGHILLAFWEMVSRRPVTERAFGFVMVGGMALIGVFFFFALSNDLTKIFSGESFLP